MTEVSIPRFCRGILTVLCDSFSETLPSGTVVVISERTV